MGSGPYVPDTWPAGPAKEGMIAVGRVVSEAPGMRACAAWMRSLVSEVPVAVIIGDPFWSPSA